MANTNGSSPGDTLEFLKLMGLGTTDETPSDEPGSARRKGASVEETNDLPPLPPLPEDEGDVEPDAAPSRRASSAASERRPIPPAEEAKPVVIKGGPRRVVRADGRQPEVSQALGQRRFALSSGHAMFSARKRMNPWVVSAIAVAAIAAIAAVFFVSWNAAKSWTQRDLQNEVVGTVDYDSSLSLTPADDGGYYTAFVVTSTTTDEESIGDLSQVLLVRTDKEVTDYLLPIRVAVPANLYVLNNSTGEASTIAQLLASSGINSVLNGIDAALGTRIYNVVCCEQDVYDSLYAIMSGQTDASSFDADTLLGKVRSNLTLQGIVDYCAKLAPMAGSVTEFTVPTTELDVNGTLMAQTDPSTYVNALNNAKIKRDEYGNYAGTQYDENGNPIVDWRGNIVLG